jgi:hypothetical protein
MSVKLKYIIALNCDKCKENILTVSQQAAGHDSQ